MENPDVWKDNSYDLGYKKGLEDGRKEIKYATEPNKAVEDMIRRATRHMSQEKLSEITTKVADIFRKTQFYDCTDCENGDCINCEKPHTVYFLLDMIASLHNELYNEVTGKYYDYIFHWANHGYMGNPNDGLFKDKELIANGEDGTTEKRD